MSFGFSVGDIITLANLATQCYQGWESACGQYASFTSDLSILRLILRRVEEEAEKPDSVFTRNADDLVDWETVITPCRETLEELDSVLKKYKSLGRSRRDNWDGIKRNWDKLRMGTRSYESLHRRLAKANSSLTAYLTVLGLSSQMRLENSLLPLILERVDDIAAQVRKGNSTVRTSMTRYSNDDADVWREFRRDLVRRGFRSADLHRFSAAVRIHLGRLQREGLLDEEIPAESLTDLHPANASSSLPEVQAERSASSQLRDATLTEDESDSGSADTGYDPRLSPSHDQSSTVGTHEISVLPNGVQGTDGLEAGKIHTAPSQTRPSTYVVPSVEDGVEDNPLGKEAPNDSAGQPSPDLPEDDHDDPPGDSDDARNSPVELSQPVEHAVVGATDRHKRFVRTDPPSSSEEPSVAERTRNRSDPSPIPPTMKRAATMPTALNQARTLDARRMYGEIPHSPSPYQARTSEAPRMYGEIPHSPSPSAPPLSEDRRYGNQHVPTYPKVHSDYLDIETILYYDLPWERDKRDGNFYIILRELSKEETDVLFEHTRRRRERLAGLASAAPPPVYPKIHRDYLDEETLRYYDLPWERDRRDPNFYIILREMPKEETDVLFEHTKRMRERTRPRDATRRSKTLYRSSKSGKGGILP